MNQRPTRRAHEEFKKATRAIWWQMTCCAALLHFLVFLFNPNLRIDLQPYASWTNTAVAQQYMIESLPADAIPDSPRLDSRPQVPRRAEVDLSENITIADWSMR